MPRPEFIIKTVDRRFQLPKPGHALRNTILSLTGTTLLATAAALAAPWWLAVALGLWATYRAAIVIFAAFVLDNFAAEYRDRLDLIPAPLRAQLDGSARG